MWRTHSCVPRRDFIDASGIVNTGLGVESLDTARKSACATSNRRLRSIAPPVRAGILDEWATATNIGNPRPYGRGYEARRFFRSLPGNRQPR
jgi:hypothetical protein